MTWHQRTPRRQCAGTAVPAGISDERQVDVDPAADNALGASWCTATSSWAAADRGTPFAASWCSPPGANPIVVTEVMFDPETPPSERAAEWFEVANLGTTTIDLTGWTITAGDYKRHTIGALVIAPGTLAVLAANGGQATNGDIVADYVYGSELPLYNESGRVVLSDANGAVVDRVEWSEQRSFPIPSGASIALNFATSNNELGSNWCASNARWASGDFGSPGAVAGCVAPPPPAPIRISEVLRNPAAVGDSVGEWFEVRNQGTVDVDLRGWSLTDTASDHHVITSSVVVPAGGLTVLGRRADPAVNGGVPVAYAYGDGFVLSNNEDRLVLRDQYDQVVDELAWARDGSPRPNGASMALLDGGWCVSGPQFGHGDLGTPGTANDCTPLPHPAVVITEIHADPAAVSDTVGEWLEITNAGEAPIDLAGWQLRDDDADIHTISGPLVVAPGASVVLGREHSAALNGGAAIDYSYGVGFPLSNDEDEITLVDAGRVWVDRVTWDAGRRLPFVAGRSASLRALSSDNADPASWCGSVTPFGTLGELGTPRAASVCDDPTTNTTTSTSTTTTSTTTTSTTTTSTTTTSTSVPDTTSTTGTTSVPETTSTTSTTSTTVAQPALANALFATDTGCAAGLQVSGARISIHGGMRSNSAVTLQGSAVAVSGTVSYATNASLGRSVTAAAVAQEPTPASPPAWTVADFAPGGGYSIRPGYVAHIGSWTVGVEGASAGIHYVEGNVTISGAAPDLIGVTIVATGTVKVSGGTVLSPAAPDVPAVLAGGGSCSQAAINLSGNSITWTGTLAAPNGGVQVNGSKLVGGSIVASWIQMSGSDIIVAA